MPGRAAMQRKRIPFHRPSPAAPCGSMPPKDSCKTTTLLQNPFFRTMKWLTNLVFLSCLFQTSWPAFQNLLLGKDRNIDLRLCTGIRKLPVCLTLRRASCNLSGDSGKRVKLPPIPIVTTYEKTILFPGETIDIDNPSPGTVKALSIAKAFVCNLV